MDGDLSKTALSSLSLGLDEDAVDWADWMSTTMNRV